MRLEKAGPSNKQGQQCPEYPKIGGKRGGSARPPTHQSHTVVAILSLMLVPSSPLMGRYTTSFFTLYPHA